MLRTDAILDTIRMFQEENLDVRTVTLGLNLRDCSSPSLAHLIDKIRAKVAQQAAMLVRTADAVGREFGIPVVNKRVAVSAVSDLAAQHSRSGMVQIAQALDLAAADVGVDFLGGFSAMVDKGITPSDRALIEAMPEALSTTRRVCASVNVASTRAGINMDAVLLMGRINRALADASADQGGFAAAKLVIFANMPDANPFMAGAVHGVGEADAVINIGVSGPGVVKRALQRLIDAAEARQRVSATSPPPPAMHGRLSAPDLLTLADLAEEMKTTAFRVTRVGELIGREVARRLGVAFGIVDLSLAPTPKVGDSIGEILQVMGIAAIGGPGSTAALAMLNDAVKKGGAFASSSVGGLSGAFIPVMEDAALAQAVKDGSLSLEKLEAMTSVCSVGLDMVPIPGDVSGETIAGLIADEMAIGVFNNKTTATRLIPVPGRKAGDLVSFGGLFGESTILPVRSASANDTFARYGGRIPAPLHSLRN